MKRGLLALGFLLIAGVGVQAQEVPTMTNADSSGTPVVEGVVWLNKVLNFPDDYAGRTVQVGPVGLSFDFEPVGRSDARVMVVSSPAGSPNNAFSASGISRNQVAFLVDTDLAHSLTSYGTSPDTWWRLTARIDKYEDGGKVYYVGAVTRVELLATVYGQRGFVVKWAASGDPLRIDFTGPN